MKYSIVRDLIDGLSVPGAPDHDGGGIDDAKLEAVLAAARVAPSADNAQSWRFVTVQREDRKKQIGQAVPDASLAEGLVASQTIVVLCGIEWAVKGTRREQPFVLIDVPIALTHMLFQATELKLRSCWTLDMDEAAVRKVLSIPQSVRVLALIGLS